MVRDLNGHSTETLPVLASHKPICVIDSLCDDVLLSIFLFFHQACLACYDERAYDCLSTARSPWVLSHVCHNWRALVVSFPLLWTNIYIDTDNYIYHPSSRALALETVLQRSGDLALDVQIEDAQQQAEPDFTRKQVEEVRACGRSLVRLLLPTTGRWRQLAISSSCDVFDALVGCSFERLQSLELYYFLYGDQEDVVVTLFRNATNLLEVTIPCQYDLDFVFPLAGIRTFSVGCNGLHFLPSMLSLQNLRIEDTCGSDVLEHIRLKWEQDGVGSFELPSLRTITVRETTTNHISRELSRRLRAPTLTTLILHVRRDFEQHDPPVPRSRFPVFDNLHSLVNLSINFTELEATDTIPFLTHTSSVRNLYLGSSVATLAVLEAIGLGVVPRLQTLGLHFSTWEKSSDGVISMLERRTMNTISADHIAVVKFARFDPSYVFNRFTGEPNDGWGEWLWREDISVQEASSASWEMIQEKIGMCIVEKYSFDL